MNNNMAFVAYLENIQPIIGADKIVQADVVLNGIKITQVVVGVDTKPHTKIVYFDSNMCLEQSFINAVDKQSEDYGKEGFKSLGLYLSKNGRIKVVKLKNIISNGLAVEVSKFAQFTTDIDMEGLPMLPESFTSIGGTEICHKYQPPQKRVQVQGKKGHRVKATSRLIPDQFHFHTDTDQLLRNVHKLNPDQVISISRKIHGTSAIASYCLVKRKLSLIERIAKMIGINVTDTEYDYIYASRTVVKNDATTSGFYKEDIWTEAGNKNFKTKLHPGESVYYEIVGFLPSGGAIQKGYRYDCAPGTYKIAVYRITLTGLDGTVYEYGWQAMKQRCVELQVPMVQEYYYGRASDFPLYVNPEPENWVSYFVDDLKQAYLEKKAQDCDGNPDEGIVIRIEGLNIEAYKLKSESFLLKESKAHEEEVIDIEEEV
jgi:hypothetical protein